MLFMNSWTRSGKGRSSRLPFIAVFVRFFWLISCMRFRRVSVLSAKWSPPSSLEGTMRAIDVPMSSLSPLLRAMRRTFSPLTKVPLVEPKSTRMSSSPSARTLACWRRPFLLRVRYRSPDRPMINSPPSGTAKAAPLYFPEMNLGRARALP